MECFHFLYQRLGEWGMQNWMQGKYWQSRVMTHGLNMRYVPQHNTHLACCSLSKINGLFFLLHLKNSILFWPCAHSLFVFSQHHFYLYLFLVELCHVLQHEFRFKEVVHFMETCLESWNACCSFLYNTLFPYLILFRDPHITDGRQFANYV